MPGSSTSGETRSFSWKRSGVRRALRRSRKKDGFTFDTGGSHIIFSRDTEVLAFMRRMIAENEQRNNRNTKIFYKGRHVKYPFENGLYELPPEDRFACINGFVKNLIAVEKGDVATTGKLPGMDLLHVWPGHCRVLHGAVQREDLEIPNRGDVVPLGGRPHSPAPVEDIIRSAIGIETEGYTHQAVFSYPLDGGIEALVRAIARPVESFIRTGFRVTSVEESGSTWLISNGRETIGPTG